MRIGLVIYGTLDTISGGYLYDRKLVQHLREQGDTVEIISLPWRSYPLHLRDNLRRDLYQRLLSLDVDLLLQDELNHPSLFWINQRLSRRVHYPIISIVHHLRISEQWSKPAASFYKKIEQRYLRTIDGFIFNSQTTRASVAAVGIDTVQSIVAYPAADHLPIPRALHIEPSTGPLRLLFVGNIIERKGLQQLISALAALNSAEWRLDIVGNATVDTAYAQSIYQQITAADLADRITFHGSVDDLALAEKYRQSDLLAVPSYEGFGIVYLEAMGFGLPVIASTAGAAHEIVNDGENGFLVDLNDVESLSHRIQTFINDHNSLYEMSHSARRHYEQHPTWHESASQIRYWLRTVR